MTTRRDVALGIDWPVAPMLAKLASAVPADEEHWAFEVKWDGIRLVARVEGGRLQLLTRNLIDATARYPEVGGLVTASAGHTAVLDGELVRFDRSGRATFEALQQHRGDGAGGASVNAGGVSYIVFDVLALDGRSLLDRPFRERRAVLEGLELEGAHWHTPSSSVGGGHDLLLETREQGLEGIIAKRLESTYETGERTGAWLKIKNQQRQEFVIGGWTPGAGKRAGTIGSIVLGYNDGPDFVCAGKVGTGFNDAMLGELAILLAPLARPDSPFTRGVVPRDVHFVEPRLVCEVEFMEWTGRSGQLRHPSFKGLRTDKSASDVIRETP